MSHCTTIKVIDKLGDGFDTEVLKWKKQAEDVMNMDEYSR